MEELRAWCEAQGLTRFAVAADERGDISEIERLPMVALGPRDDDFYIAPNPDDCHYGGIPLRDMSVEDYNRFMFRWLEVAVRQGDMQCANCGKPLADGDDLPAADRWDALFFEKELVGWMLAHFDCKRWLAKKLKGLQPFDIAPHPAKHYDLSGIELSAEEKSHHA